MRNKFFVALMAVAVTALTSFSFASAAAQAQSYEGEDLSNVTLTVGVYPTGSPLAFIEQDITKPRGIDVDIILELQRRLKFNLTDNRIFPLDIQFGFKQLKAGKLDIFAGGISYVESRTVDYDYTPIYYFASMGIIYSKERMPGKVSLKDFKGKKIGYQKGTTSDHIVNLYSLNGVEVNNNVLGYFAVSSGSIDGYLYDRPPLASFASEMKSLNLAVTEDRFGEEATQYAIMLAKDSPYNALINETMEEMIMDGTIEAILKKWNAQ